MARIIDAFDYGFYRLYKFVLAHKFVMGDKDDKRISSIAIYILIYTIPFNVSVIAPILRAYKIHISRYEMSGLLVYLLLILEALPFCIRYWKEERVQKLEERWGHEDPYMRKMRGWLLLAMTINNLILIPLFVIILCHYHIL